MRDRSLKSQNWQKSFVQKGFWRSFAHNWSRIIGCNSILLGANLISTLIALLIVFFAAPMISSLFTFDGMKSFMIDNELVAAEALTDQAVETFFFMLSFLMAFLLSGLMLVVNGPFYSAVSYYFKNLLIGEASFKSDFKSGLKDNWKKSLGVSVISVLLTTLALFNIGYYQQLDLGLVGTIAKCFFLTVLVFWSAMQIYVYPLIACVELRFVDVLRNAAWMVLKKPLSSFGLVLLEAVLFGVMPFVLVLVFNSKGYAVTTLLYLVLSYGFICFISVYLTWKAVQQIIENDI